MEAIKRIVRTPKNREVLLKIPDYVQENEPVEIIIFIRKKPADYANKIKALKEAAGDVNFLRDVAEVTEDFEAADFGYRG